MKSFLGIFYGHLAIFLWSYWPLYSFDTVCKQGLNNDWRAIPLVKGDGGSYRPKWYAATLMKYQNNKDSS